MITPRVFYGKELGRGPLRLFLQDPAETMFFVAYYGQLSAHEAMALQQSEAVSLFGPLKYRGSLNRYHVNDPHFSLALLRKVRIEGVVLPEELTGALAAWHSEGIHRTLAIALYYNAYTTRVRMSHSPCYFDHVTIDLPSKLFSSSRLLEKAWGMGIHIEKLPKLLV